jgi:hypothetical protein
MGIPIGAVIVSRMINIYLRKTLLKPVDKVRGAQIPSARSPGYCGSSVWNLFYFTVLAPKILRWLLDFGKTCGPLVKVIVSLY